MYVRNYRRWQTNSEELVPELSRRRRLLVLTVDDGSNDAEPIRIAMDDQLKAHRIDHRVAEASGNEQMEEPATRDGFIPDATLRLTPSLTIRTQYGDRDEVHVDASLYLAGESSHRIWRAKVIHGTGSTNTDAAGMVRWATLFARRVVDQFLIDRVLR